MIKLTRDLTWILLLTGVFIAGCGKKPSAVADKNVAPPTEPETPPVADESRAATPAAVEKDTVADELDTDDQSQGADPELNEFAIDPPSASSGGTTNESERFELDLTNNIFKDTEGDIEVEVSQPADVVMIAVPPPAFRMLLPTTAGPLVVDAEIHLGDEELSRAFDLRIEKVIADANDDPETALTWDELFDHVSGSPELFGRQQMSMNRGQKRQMIQQYDSDRNSRADRDEVARFVFRSNGINVPFRLMGTDYYREINRSDSALFAAIDTDGNRSLEPAEIDAASASLLRFDPNADQRIDVNEVITAPRQPNNNNDPAWNRRRINRRGEVAMDLEGYVDWTMVSYALESMRGAVPFSLKGNRIDLIDVNQNESINSHEAKELKSGPPDVRFIIKFSGESDTPTIDVAYLRWDPHHPEQATVTNRTPGDVAISDDSFTLIASVADRQTSRNRIPREAFDMLDANNDGGLDQDEIPDGAPDELSLEDLDADEDGKLTYQEINSAPADQETPVWGVQVRARGAEFPDAVFAWLDSNHDRFLATREILSAAQRLRMCSRDGQPLKATDIPDAFALQFVRADPQQDMQQNFAFASPVPISQSSQPRWAQNMDMNRDGEISRLEFPGSSEKFDKLDTDGNGFVDAVELAKANP